MQDITILSVGQLARSARQILEKNFAQVWVEGELSNFATPQSGHWYFTLKDKSAQLRCAMFAGRNRTVIFPPKDGLKVLVRGKVSLYEGRGDFQIIVDRMEPAGEGALKLAFEVLKNQLATEGLFEEERKRSLPEYPKHLVVISSGTGAAYQDVLSVIERRYPSLLISLIPVAVQGVDSEQQVLRALSDVSQWVSGRHIPATSNFDLPPDLLLVTRGGGSLEDLWTFNLETVARALAECPIPAVSAIGHETDFTITDFVADLRAPTPSAAAEIITPDSNDLKLRFTRLQQSLAAQVRRSMVFHGQQLALLNNQLIHPGLKLQQQMQKLDDTRGRLDAALERTLDSITTQLKHSQSSLFGFRPLRELKHANNKLQSSYLRLSQSLQYRMHKSSAVLQIVSRALHSVSPLDTLSRGYAIVNKAGDGPESRVSSVVKSVKDLSTGDTTITRFMDGEASSVVQNVTLLPEQD